MGSRGPIRQPASLKLVKGNPGKRRIKAAPSPVAAKVTCPGWLTKAAKAEWRRVAPELERLGFLTILDRAALAGYCENYAVWVECSLFVQQHGEHYLTPRGQLRQWPQAETARKAEQSMRAFAGEFGLTPNARARLSVDEPRKDQEDEFAKFLRRAT